MGRGSFSFGAGFGVFSLFFMLGEAMSGASQIGVWLGLVMALGTAGAFIPLALFRPMEIPALQSLNLPLTKPHGALVIALTAGISLGFVYMILAVIA